MEMKKFKQLHYEDGVTIKFLPLHNIHRLYGIFTKQEEVYNHYRSYVVFNQK